MKLQSEYFAIIKHFRDIKKSHFIKIVFPALHFVRIHAQCGRKSTLFTLMKLRKQQQ